MLRETRLHVAVALMVQAVSFVFMFLILCAKKRSIAAAFLAVAAMNGVAGGYLLRQIYEEESYDSENDDSVAVGCDFSDDND